MTDELISVFKDGMTVKVHPSTLENHLKLGWSRVAEKPTADSEPVSVETKDLKPADQKKSKV